MMGKVCVQCSILTTTSAPQVFWKSVKKNELNVTGCLILLHQIIFYEDRNFGGRHYECMSDCADLHSMFDRCRSIRVESGMFMIYDRPGYMGNQYFMKRGEYSDYLSMTGMNDCVRSCRMIPVVRPSVK